MKRLITFVLLCLLLFACSPDRKPDTPDTCLPAVMLNGTVYVSDFEALAGDVDPSAIAGYIDSVVPLSQLPAENGQANFDALGAPYAFTDLGLVVLCQNEWVQFVPLP